MRRGELLLVDELNLAEDAVLERLNRGLRGLLLLNIVMRVAGRPC
eukprot:gene10384-10542_t